MEFTGKVIAVLDAKEGVSKSTGKEWKVQEFVVEDHNQYPHRACFELFGAEKIDSIMPSIGAEVTVSFDVDSSEYNGRWYTKLRAWKIDSFQKQSEPATQGVGKTPDAVQNFLSATNAQPTKDKLPF